MAKGLYRLCSRRPPPFFFNQLQRRRWQRGFIVYTAGACACVGFVASTSQTPPVLFFNDGEKPKQNGAAAPARQPRPKTQLRRRRWQRGCISYAAGACGFSFYVADPPQFGSSTTEKKTRYVEVPGFRPSSALHLGLHLVRGVSPTKKQNTSYVGDGGLRRRRCMLRAAAFSKQKVPPLYSTMKTAVLRVSSVQDARPKAGATPN